MEAKGILRPSFAGIFHLEEFMNPISRLIFDEAYRIHQFSSEGVFHALAEQGVNWKSEGIIRRFEYTDEHPIAVVVSFLPSGDIASFRLGIHLLGDEMGWDGWSSERENQRLLIQGRWMKANGLKETTKGPFHISNSFSEKDAASSIVISNAESGSAGSTFRTKLP